MKLQSAWESAWAAVVGVVGVVLWMVLFGATEPREAGPAGAAPATRAATEPAGGTKPGERVPTELEGVKDFHSLGLVQGKLTIFRSASPVRDLVKNVEAVSEDAALLKAATARLQKWRELGVRTIVSLEDPEGKDETEEGGAAKRRWLALEQAAAKEAGITLVYRPLVNAGPNSLETMTAAEVQKVLDPLVADIVEFAGQGGVVFHCAAGHDRTGLVAAYMRVKLQHWSVEEAIAEMRRLGHNWVRYSKNGGTSSWHEDLLRGLAEGAGR